MTLNPDGLKAAQAVFETFHERDGLEVALMAAIRAYLAHNAQIEPRAEHTPDELLRELEQMLVEARARHDHREPPTLGTEPESAPWPVPMRQGDDDQETPFKPTEGL